MMETNLESTQSWYIIKRSDGHCEIVPGNSDQTRSDSPTSEPIDSSEQWGPYNSQAEAIARRVGLIRAGKCQPI